MDRDLNSPPRETSQTANVASRQDQPPCWQEMLDDALSGWPPAEQALETLIDRVGRAS